MFPRTVKSKGETYLRIVESYRENGKKRQRVIANLGNIKKLRAKKQIDGLILGLRRFTQTIFARIDEIENHGGPEYGRVLIGGKLFEEIGLGEILREKFRRTKAKKVNEETVKVMVLNRLCDPKSKLGIFRWLEDTYLPGWEVDEDFGEKERKWAAENFYRALDYIERWKEDIEKELYLRLRDLFSLKVTLILYDITSVYFEGEGPEELAKFGKSKDGKRRNKQVLLGLIMCQGLPIGHHVFKGNILDKMTVKGVVADLKERYEIRGFVFVGDRGMVKRDTIEYLEEEKLEYIVALRRRRCLEMARAVEMEFREEDKIAEEFYIKEVAGAEELVKEEWGLAAEKGRRLFMCLNTERSEDEKRKRAEKMEKIEVELKALAESVKAGNIVDEQRIAVKAAEILSRRNGKRYFETEIKGRGDFEFRENKRSLEYEKKLDGKFILLTNVESLNAKGVIDGYKELTEVEDAFRELKDFIKIRPVYHRKKARVKGHIFVAVMSYLLEKVLGRKLKAAGVDKTARRALSDIRRIKAVEEKICGKRFIGITVPNENEWRILKTVGIRQLPRIMEPKISKSEYLIL